MNHAKKIKKKTLRAKQRQEDKQQRRIKFHLKAQRDVWLEKERQSSHPYSFEELHTRTLTIYTPPSRSREKVREYKGFIRENYNMAGFYKKSYEGVGMASWSPRRFPKALPTLGKNAVLHSQSSSRQIFLDPEKEQPITFWQVSIQKINENRLFLSQSTLFNPKVKEKECLQISETISLMMLFA